MDDGAQLEAALDPQGVSKIDLKSANATASSLGLKSSRILKPRLLRQILSLTRQKTNNRNGTLLYVQYKKGTVATTNDSGHVATASLAIL